MSIDLSDFYSNFLDHVSPVGQSSTLFPNTQTEVVRRMVNAFWTLRIQGVDCLTAYSCTEDGTIQPVPNTSGSLYTSIPVSWYTDPGGTTDASTGLADLGREVIELIIIMAAVQAVQALIMNLKTRTAYKAGSVSYEVEQTATMVTALLKTLWGQLDMILTRMSDLGFTTVGVSDAIMQVTVNTELGNSTWARGSFPDSGGRVGTMGSWY